MPVSTTNKALPAKEPKKRSFREFAIRNRYIWLSFLIPFVLMVTAFALMSVSPFGDKQILVTDLWHQYSRVPLTSCRCSYLPTGCGSF